MTDPSTPPIQPQPPEPSVNLDKEQVPLSPPPPNYPPSYTPPPAQGYGPPPSNGQWQMPPVQPGQPTFPPPPGYMGNPYTGYGVPGFKKPVGWFIVNWLFFWPIAIYSLVSPWSAMSSALTMGDVNAANFYAAKVRKLGKIALGIGLLWSILWIILSVVIVANGSGNCVDSSSAGSYSVNCGPNY